MTQFVWDRDKVRGLYEQTNGRLARQISDRLWFKEAVAVTAQPFAAIVNEKVVFLWMSTVYDRLTVELWGGTWNDGEDLSYLVQDDVEELLDSLSSPVYLEHLVTPVPALDIKWCVSHEKWIALCKVCWGSWDEFEHSVWSGKRRREIRRELKPYRSFKICTGSEFDNCEFEWLVDRSHRNCDRTGVRNPILHECIRRVLLEAERMGQFRSIRIEDSGKLIALEMFVEDLELRRISTLIGHTDLEYPSLGKMLYEILIRYAIERGFKEIDAGESWTQIKKTYGYSGVPVGIFSRGIRELE